jgi:hypothetical protein
MVLKNKGEEIKIISPQRHREHSGKIEYSLYQYSVILYDSDGSYYLMLDKYWQDLSIKLRFGQDYRKQ